MIKKLGLILSFMSADLLQAMDSNSYNSTNSQGYVIKITGLGAAATTEVIYDR